jgi:crotonobetainyl-CoA:carnitine CoA-transferase CaiB-like acyl-CoA transferase
LEGEGKSAQVLDGIRVLDCSIAMAGPFAAQRLGDLGADVIKIEPVGGEWHRGVAAGNATGNRINASFLSLNRNKRSIAVDLKSAAGRDIVYRLVDSADVFLQNYRPGVAERLGMDCATLSARNPRLVYVSISGYGEDGPYRLRPGQDLLLQAMSGGMMSTGRAEDRPTPAGQYLVDAVTAYNAFEGALAALFHRERTGKGQRVDVNMLDAIVSLQMQELSVFTVGHKPQRRSTQPHGHVYIRAPYGVFRTRDGIWIVLSLSSLKTLSEILGVPEFLAMDEATAGHEQRDRVFELTEEAILRHDAAPLLEAFDRLGVWAGRVYGYQDLVDDPQVRHNGSFVEYEHPTEGHVKTPGFPIRFASTPSRVNRGAPLEGQHTREILAEAGFDAEAVSRLLAEKTVSEVPV